jgi:hypothetical protein
MIWPSNCGDTLDSDVSSIWDAPRGNAPKRTNHLRRDDLLAGFAGFANSRPLKPMFLTLGLSIGQVKQVRYGDESATVIVDADATTALCVLNPTARFERIEFRWNRQTEVLSSVQAVRQRPMLNFSGIHELSDSESELVVCR